MRFVTPKGEGGSSVAPKEEGVQGAQEVPIRRVRCREALTSACNSNGKMTSPGDMERT